MEDNKQKTEEVDDEVVVSGRKLECMIILGILWWMISVGAAFILGVCLHIE